MIESLDMNRVVTNIFPKGPYDFELTVGYHTYYRSRYGADHWEDDKYRRLLEIDNKLLLASVRSTGTVDRPELEVVVEGTALSQYDVTRAKSQIEWILGTSQDLTQFYGSIVDDDPLNNFCQHLYGLHIPHAQSPYESLILAVLGQQISNNVARLIRTLIIEKYGSPAKYNGMDYYAFPQPISLAKASLEDLRLLKMSYRKAEYINGISQVIADQSDLLTFAEYQDNNEIVSKIMQLRGVGRWTAQWLLIKGLGRMDAFPVGDLALKQMLTKLYFDQTPLKEEEMEPFSKRWSPWRSYATTYLFAANRQGLI